MGEIRCELSWSPSRAKTFESCRRQYYYQYYGSWRGWEAQADPLPRLLYRLKQMKSLDVFTGIVVHDLIAEWFAASRKGEIQDYAALEARARQRFDRAWRESLSGAWQRDPKRVARFVEHHYAEEVSPARAGVVWLKVQSALRAFFDMPELEPIRASKPATWLAVESLDTFQVADTKVYAVPDFAFRHDGVMWILDWKTGKPRAEDERQIKVYALYARDKWNARAADLRLSLVYLPQSSIKDVSADDAELIHMQGDIAHGIELLNDVHFDPDRTKVELKHFPPHGAPRECRYCVFKEACEAAPKAVAASD